VKLKENRILDYVLIFSPFVIFAFCVLFRNFTLFERFCQKNYDLGIYMEVMRESGKGIINPWLQGRQIYQIADHWTPIMSLMGQLTRWFQGVNVALIGEICFYFLAWGTLFWLFLQKKMSASYLALASAIMFLNRDQFEAAYFPVHESTWAALPLMLLGLEIFKFDFKKEDFNREVRVFCILLFLCLFSEQFGFVAFGWGLGLLALRKRTGWFYLLFGFLMSWALIMGRAIVFGPTFPYFQQRILIPPAELIAKYFPIDSDMIKTMVLHFLFFVPAVFLGFRKVGTHPLARKRFVLLLGAFGPLLLGRVMAGNFHLQYSVALTTFWVLLFVLTAKVDQKLNPKWVLGVLIFCVLFSNNKLRKPFATAFAHTGMECVHGTVDKSGIEKRQERLRQAFEKISAEPNSKVLSIGNLIPNFLNDFKNLQILQMGGYAIISTKKVDWVITERGIFGDRHFITTEKIEEMIELVKSQPGVEVLVDDKDLFLAKGPIQVEGFNDKFYQSNPMPY
jgi:uncharacterized membrane protein